MNVNWFTVIAQVINFLILVWLLKKFLYKPVLDAIDAREKKIVSRLQDAESKMAEAKKEQDDFAEKNKQFDAQKKELMDKAIADTNRQKDKLLEAARKDVDALHAKQQKTIADMQQNLKTELAQKTQKEVFDISRKALLEIASVGLEEQAVKFFISRLDELKDEEKTKFTDAFTSGSKPVLVQSAFELAKPQQTEINKSVDKILGRETSLEFKTSPEIIGGIELIANGYKLSWSIAAYLDGLQNDISETLKNTALSAPEAKDAAGNKQAHEAEPVQQKK